MFLLIASAALIDHGTFTTDDVTGLDWLDLTETVGMSFNFVSSQLGTGGQFEGWSYATAAQVSQLWDHAGGNGIYTGSDPAHTTFIQYLQPLWGITWVNSSGSETSRGITIDIAGSFIPPSRVVSGITANTVVDPDFYWARLNDLGWDPTTTGAGVGSALVRASVVPIPAAVWLFGSGLLGLFGLARRKAY